MGIYGNRRWKEVTLIRCGSIDVGGLPNVTDKEEQELRVQDTECWRGEMGGLCDFVSGRYGEC